MNKKFWISGVVASVLSFIFGFIVHGVLLTDDYMKLKSLFRTEEEAMSNTPIMIVSHLIKGFALAWIYRQGVTAGAPWFAQGIRFGIAAVLLVTVPWYLIYYAVQPWPVSTVVKQITFDGNSMIITALAVAFISKPAGGAVTD